MVQEKQVEQQVALLAAVAVVREEVQPPQVVQTATLLVGLEVLHKTARQVVQLEQVQQEMEVMVLVVVVVVELVLMQVEMAEMVLSGQATLVALLLAQVAAVVVQAAPV